MSFAQEMRDFFAAAAAGQKLIGAADDRAYNAAKKKYLEAQTTTIENKNNDTEGDKLTKDAQRSLIRSRDAATALTSKRGQLVDAQRTALTASAGPDPMLSDLKPTMDAPTTAPAIGGDEATPAAAATVNPAVQPSGIPAPVEQAPLDPELTPPEQAGGYSRGGAVQHFADGGAVGAVDTEDAQDEAAPDEEAPEEEAAPAVGGEGASDTTDISARSRGGAPTFSADAALDAGKAGLKYGVRALGLDSRAAVADPQRTRRLQAYASGAGAAQPTDLVAVRKAIDPEGKLGESSANLAALGAVYQYKMNKGDEAGAQRAAFALIQHYRVSSQQYAAMAAAASEKGDIDNAMKLVMKSYANVPDGKDLKLTKTEDGKISYSFTDEKTGKVVSKGIETPDKLAATAIGFARGQGFDAALLAAAGQKPEKPAKGAVDPDAPMKTADKKTALKQIDDAYAEQNPDDKEGKPKYAPDDALALKGAAFRIASHAGNAKLIPGEAVSAVTKIADPTALDKSGFTTKKADGGYQVTFPGKQPVFVPEATFATLITKRNEKLKAIKQQQDEAAKPGMLSKAAGAVGGAISAGVNKLADIRESNQQAIRRKEFTEPQIP
ncbi:hypothetical protein [Bradyrhizobium cenepequi]